MDNKQKVISTEDALKLAADSYTQGFIDAVEITRGALLTNEGQNITIRDDFITLLDIVESDMTEEAKGL